MEKLALSVVIGGAIASSFNSSMNSSTKSITQIGSEVKKLNKEKLDLKNHKGFQKTLTKDRKELVALGKELKDQGVSLNDFTSKSGDLSDEVKGKIKRFKELRNTTRNNEKSFKKLGESLKNRGVDFKNLSDHTKNLNKDFVKLKKNMIIKGKIQLEKNKLFEQKDSLLATFGTGMAISGFINLRSEILQAQGELRSLKIGDVGIEKITAEAKKFSSTYAGTTAPEFIKASYDIKSGISSLGDEAVGKFTSLAAITAGATKSSTDQMTSFFATGYGVYSKQFQEFAAKTVDGWDQLSQEEKDIKFGESFSAGIGSAVQMFKTDGTKMQSAIETLGAAATTSNVPFAEQLSILGQMQKSFASGSEAATAYKGFLSGAVDAQDKLGLSFLDSNNQLKSAPLILEQLRDKYGETLDDMEKQEIKKAFGTEEGMKFITAFYGEVDELKNNINAMGESVQDGTKTIDDMMAATQQGKGFQLLGQQMANLGATIGKIFYPAVSMLGNVLGAVAVGLDNLITTFPTLSSGIGYLIVGIFSYIAIMKTAKLITFAHRIAMLSLRGSFLANIPALKGLRLAMNRFTFATAAASIKTKALSLWTGVLGMKAKAAALASGVFKAAMIGVNFVLRANPIGLVVTAIGGLIAGVVYAYNKFDWFKNGVNAVWETIKAVFSFSPFEQIKQIYGQVFDWLSSKFDWFGKSIDKLKGMGSSIKSFFGFGDDKEDQKQEEKKEQFSLFKSKEEKTTINKVQNQESNNRSYKPGSTIKKAAAATIATTQLVAAQPNINYAPVPGVEKKEIKRVVQQTNHIKVIVNNPKETVDVEKAIVNAMNSSGADRGLSDEDI